MLELFYLKLAQTLTVALVTASAAAALILWNGPAPVGFKNTDAATMKMAAVGVVGILGAFLPLLTLASKAASFSRSKAAVFGVAGLANSFALSPALTVPFKEVLCTIGLVIAFATTIGQIAVSWSSPEAKPPKGKF